jgi:hypothetical protein
MKKFLFVLLFSTSAMAIITDPMSNFFDNTGTVIKKDKVFIQVKAGNAVSAGDVVIPSVSADDGATVVHTSELGGKALCIMAETLAVGGKGLCQVYGYAMVNHSAFGDDAVAGSALYASNNASGGKVSGITSPAASDHPIGIALDASSATESIEAFIQLL